MDATDASDNVQNCCQRQRSGLLCIPPCPMQATPKKVVRNGLHVIGLAKLRHEVAKLPHPPADQPATVALHAPHGGQIIVVDGARVALLEQACPHQFCPLQVAAKERLLSCPCHGSLFDYSGKLLRGPAERSLRWHATRIDDDALLVDRRSGVLTHRNGRYLCHDDITAAAFAPPNPTHPCRSCDRFDGRRMHCQRRCGCPVGHNCFGNRATLRRLPHRCLAEATGPSGACSDRQRLHRLPRWASCCARQSLRPRARRCCCGYNSPIAPELGVAGNVHAMPQRRRHIVDRSSCCGRERPALATNAGGFADDCR